MKNQTLDPVFILYGLSDLPSQRVLLLVIFLLTFLMTVATNLLILLLIVTDSNLHTPMYFFLGNLATLDVCYSSVTSPRMLYDLFSMKNTINLTACTTQIFFFVFFLSAEVSLLTIMSYDRYVAICLPLHYIQIMHRKFCAMLTSIAWIIGFLYSLTHTLLTKRLTFCGPNVIQNFFCDLPQLFQLSCSGVFLNILLIFVFGGILGMGSFTITVISYIFIFVSVGKISTNTGKSKGFSTCVTHLIVVTSFYSTLFFTYFRPNTSYQFAQDRLISLIYAIITPFLNPLIYSLRNNVLKKALKRFQIKSTLLP
ncbi:olfactory receptor 5V1-like [Bombina bombina]|uniref:olfactory receptor 5V1-like n=1 Tax=Bombina bombina TaxID=8345 RepID=UPI00235A573D|nr:olfactory receptor 5V1-like [Bombina bombina]